MFAETPPGHTSAPNDQRIPVPKWSPDQVVRLGTQEIFQRIAAVLAGQTIWVLAPGEEQLWQLGKALLSQVAAQPQIIIFCPTMLLVAAHLEQVCFAHDNAGVGQGAFDKDFPADILIAEQSILPVHVDFKTLAHFARWITLDLAAEDRYLRVPIEVADLTGKPGGKGYIIGIHASDERRGRKLGCEVRRCRDAAVGALNQSQAWITYLSHGGNRLIG